MSVTADDPVANAKGRRRMAELRQRQVEADARIKHLRRLAAAATEELTEAASKYSEWAAFFDGTGPMPAEQMTFDIPEG